jgi:hypothetical protein
MELFQQTPRLSLEELRGALKATGYWNQLQELGHANGVSRGTLANERLKFEWAKARRELALVVAQEYNAGEIDVLELDTAISGMISVGLRTELQQALDEGNGSFNDRAIALAEVFRRQLNAHANLERSKMYLNRGAQRAEARILQRVISVLKSADEKVVRVVVDAIREAAAEVRK